MVYGGAQNAYICCLLGSNHFYNKGLRWHLLYVCWWAAAVTVAATFFGHQPSAQQDHAREEAQPEDTRLQRSASAVKDGMWRLRGSGAV